MAVCPDFFQGLFFNILNTTGEMCFGDQISAS